MSTCFKPIIFALCVSGVIALPGIANAATSDSAESQQLQQMSQQMASMQSDMNSMKYQLAKARKQAARKKNMNTQDPPAQPLQPMRGRDILRLISEEKEYLPFDIDVPGQSFVSTGPYVGISIQYSGSNLIINSPSVNTDVQLLNIRKSIHEQLDLMGADVFKHPDHSHLLLSGVIEGQANYTNFGGAPSTTNIDVTNVSLDAIILGPSNWSLGFIEFSYDNSPPISNGVFTSTSNYTDSNSRVFVNKAFVTLGDLDSSPLYGSFGQFYVPFGTFSSTMVSDSLPKLLARTKARAILVGLQPRCKNKIYSAAYIFRGDSHVASVSKVNNGGINLGAKFDNGTISGDIGGGYIVTISDSGGMQLGNGFNVTEQMVHRVPGYDVRALLGIGKHWDFIAEYIEASKQFNAHDMSFNHHGAKPSAFDSQVSYSFTICQNKPSSVGIGYAHTNQALSLGLPMARYSAVFNTSWYRNTLQSIEFRRDHLYAASDVASGAGGVVSTPESGKFDTAVTAQFDYYF